MIANGVPPKSVYWLPTKPKLMSTSKRDIIPKAGSNTIKLKTGFYSKLLNELIAHNIDYVRVDNSQVSKKSSFSTINAFCIPYLCLPTDSAYSK